MAGRVKLGSPGAEGQKPEPRAPALPNPALPNPSVSKPDLSRIPRTTNRDAIFGGGPRPVRPARESAPSPSTTTPLPPVRDGRGDPAPVVAPHVTPSPALPPSPMASDARSKKPVPASLGEWTENKGEDPIGGAGAEAYRVGERESVNHRTGMTKKKSNRVRLNERDVMIIRLLGKYRFGYRKQIEEYFDRQDMSRRLTQLRRAGLLRNEKITQNEAVWTPTQAGIDIAGLEVPALTHGRITPTTVAHTVGLLNIGMSFEQGRDNVMNEPDYPRNWRQASAMRGSGLHLEPGETIITERMIQQSYRRQLELVGSMEKLRQMRDDALRWVPRNTNEDQMFGPEADEGNEWMFVGMGEATKAHVPDMVLVRPRNSDGSSRNVAIELELTSKNLIDWRRILQGFKDNPTFRSVVYFTHKRSVVNGVKGVNEKYVGLRMNDELFIKKYSPAQDNVLFWG